MGLYSSAARLRQGRFTVPSPKQMNDTKTANGFWLCDTVAEWGITWLPPHGWKEWLEALYTQEGHIVHDTIFDKTYRVIWTRARIHQCRVPFVRITEKEGGNGEVE